MKKRVASKPSVAPRKHDVGDASWPASNVQLRKIADLKPYERNPRLHSPEQITQIANSIKQWGWTYPVIIDEADGVIAGHGRVLAAQELKIKTVPVMVAKGWSEAQKRAYLIADNKLAEGARWDFPLLRIELGELQQLGFDLPLTGFSAMDLAAFTGTPIADDAAWGGMPEFQQGNEAYRSIVVHFKDQAAVDQFAELIGQDISEKARYLWHPAVEREELKAKKYAAA